MELVEIVPNLSEGRRKGVVASLSASLAEDERVRVLDVHSDPSHNRSVLTAVLPPGAVVRAASRLAAAALGEIDLRAHEGEHPRIGALDVFPIVPLGEFPLDSAVLLARRSGAEIAERHSIPVFLYGHAAQSASAHRLADLRRGGLDALERRLRDGELAPDFGPRHLHPSAGATAVGVRDYLIAFNVYLDSRDRDAARAIARRVRASSGGLPHVQAIGLDIAHRDRVQVSMNVTRPAETTLEEAFDAVEREAEALGISISSSEIVGLVPKSAWNESWTKRLKLPARPALLEERIRDAGIDWRAT